MPKADCRSSTYAGRKPEVRWVETKREKAKASQKAKAKTKEVAVVEEVESWAPLHLVLGGEEASLAIRARLQEKGPTIRVAPTKEAKMQPLSRGTSTRSNVQYLLIMQRYQ